MANTSINLVDLDFASLKSNFKNFLRSQKQFKDYDLDGSNMSVLMDLLAYNTFKNSFYTNMLMSESFLDTAQLRGSVISHAKELNYVPRSAKSSKAKVRISFNATGASQPYIIAKGQSLSAIVKNNNFTFTIPETISVSSANTTFSFETDIYEGRYVQDLYTFNQSTDAPPRFELSNKNADTSSLTVIVFDDQSVNGQIYSLTNTTLGLDFSDQIYFLQANQNEKYEIYFGDNVTGKRPPDNSRIVLDYRISTGNTADDALSFNLNFNPTGANNELNTSVEVETIDVSAGGANAESIESIRYFAPRSFQVQERTVTPRDYEITLQTQFPEINAVYAYGGEEVNPPKFGRVFVAVDITDVNGFPDSKKRQYYNFIKDRGIFGIEPIFISPEFSYLDISTNVRYNINLTKVNVDTIKTIISNAILDYRDENLNDFAVTFRDSKMAKQIDDADISIVSSVLNVRIYKKVPMVPGVTQDIVLNYDTALLNNIPKQEISHKTNIINTLQSSTFMLNGVICVFEDDGGGNIVLSQVNNDKHNRIHTVGTIDYTTGLVSLRNVRVDTYSGDSVKFYVRPADVDITAKNNTILTIEESQINIDVEQVRE